MTKPRLGRFTPPANIGGALTDDEWQQIEEIYSVSINAEARSELEAIRSHYLVWLHAESAEFGTSPVEAQVLIKQIEKAAEGLRYLARFDGADCDASASIAHPLKQEFRSLPVHINPRHLLAISEDNAYMRVLADEYVEPLAVLLDRDLLKAVSQSVDIAISRLSSRLNKAGGFLAGDALMALDKGLVAWAVKHKLPHGVSKNKDETHGKADWRYPRLVLFIDQLSPIGVRSFRSIEIASVSARILKMRKRRKAKP